MFPKMSILTNQANVTRHYLLIPILSTYQYFISRPTLTVAGVYSLKKYSSFSFALVDLLDLDSVFVYNRWCFWVDSLSAFSRENKQSCPRSGKGVEVWGVKDF